MKIHLHWSKRADGSCLWTDEDNSVLVAVYGPAPVKPKYELCDRATVQVHFCPLDYPPGGESDVWAEKIAQVLRQSVVEVEAHPRSLIQISIQPLCIGKGFLGVVIDTVFLALLSAGVPLKRPFVGIVVNENDIDHALIIGDPLTGMLLFEEWEGPGYQVINPSAIQSHYSNLKSLYEAAAM